MPQNEFKIRIVFFTFTIKIYLEERNEKEHPKRKLPLERKSQN